MAGHFRVVPDRLKLAAGSLEELAERLESEVYGLRQAGSNAGVATGNGLAGITIHNHAFPPPLPAADTNGNQIIGNKLTHNGVADTSEAEFGGADFAKGATVGILVGSAKVKLTGIVITGNTINNSHFGIYTKNDANKVNPKKNAFHNVKVKVKQV